MSKVPVIVELKRAFGPGETKLYQWFNQGDLADALLQANNLNSSWLHPSRDKKVYVAMLLEESDVEYARKYPDRPLLSAPNETYYGKRELDLN